MAQQQGEEEEEEEHKNDTEDMSLLTSLRHLITEEDVGVQVQVVDLLKLLISPENSRKNQVLDLQLQHVADPCVQLIERAATDKEVQLSE